MSCTLERAQPEPASTPARISIYDPPVKPRPRRPGFLLRTPYDDAFRESLKRLPADDREWTGSAWWIHELHEAATIALVVEAFGGVTIINPNGAADEVVDRNGRSIQERLL